MIQVSRIVDFRSSLYYNLTCNNVEYALLFIPVSIISLIGMEDARIVLNVSRPSPKVIQNGEICYCLQVICEQ